VLPGGCHLVVDRVAQVNGQGGLAGDDVRLPAADVEVPDGGAQLPEVPAVAHLPGLHHDQCGDQASVAPGGDRGGASVCGLAPDGEPLPGDRLHALDDATECAFVVG
jgi:hypothetical protein